MKIHRFETPFYEFYSYLCMNLSDTDLNETISHSGVVDSVNKGKVTVRVMQSSACSSCAAASYCRSGESKERLIDVETNNADYQVGQQVVLTGTARQSHLAVVLAYLLPLVLVMTVLVAATYSGLSEGVAAIVSLLVIAVYYVLLYCFRHRLADRFRFTIQANE